MNKLLSIEKSWESNIQSMYSLYNNLVGSIALKVLPNDLNLELYCKRNCREINMIFKNC